MRVTDVEITCPCGTVFIGHKNRVYCTPCRHMKYVKDRIDKNNWKNEQVRKYRADNPSGCEHHSDCLTCPFEECLI